MPVTIQTIDGKADYSITKSIYNLRDAVNGLETRLASNVVTPAALAAVRTELEVLRRAVEQLQRQVTALENP